MSFRSRALLAMLAAAIVPLVVFAAGVRGELTARLGAAHERRVSALVGVIERDLARDAEGIVRRLETIAAAMPDDDRLRLALRGAAGADRGYLIEYAGRVMRTAGLDALQLHDSSGRILSAGQFRHDFDRLAPDLPRALARRSDPVLLAWVRTPEGPLLAMVGRATVRIGGEELDLVGGIRMDDRLLARFSTGNGLDVVLVVHGHAVERGAPQTTAFSEGDPPASSVVRAIEIPVLADAGIDEPAAAAARLHIVQRGDELGAIRRSVDRWLAAAALLVSISALALGAWLSARLSRPLADLAETAGAISLSGTEPIPSVERTDEIGLVARRLTSMRRRLHSSAEALRDAERRATVGEMARQVNHDIKNGLVPIRNVLRHLAEVHDGAPGELATVFGERRHTLDASVGYLDALARRYARLAPRPDGGLVDVASVARDAVSAARAAGAPVGLDAGDALPPVRGDALAMRRIADNLVRNAVESLTSEAGSVIVRADRTAGGVRLVVCDTGRGMSERELAKAFDDFHTTKPEGTGLGLSVVRRLTSDLGGRLHVETAPGRGTTVSVELPIPHGWGHEARHSHLHSRT